MEVNEVSELIIQNKTETNNNINIPHWVREENNKRVQKLMSETQNSNSQFDLPDYYSFGAAADRLIGSSVTTTNEDFSDDPTYQTLLVEVNRAKAKAIDLSVQPKMTQEQLDKLFEKELAHKRLLEKAFSSGHYLTHATFLEDMPIVLRSGGLMSPSARAIKSKESGEEFGKPAARRYGTLRTPDANGVFFHYVDKEDFMYLTPYYLDHERTDVRIYISVEDAFNQAEVLHISSNNHDSDKVRIGEVVATNSQTSIKSGTRTGEADDTTKILLDNAYFRVDDPMNFDRLKSLLKETGRDDNWIDEHVIPNGLDPVDYMNSKRGVSSNPKPDLVLYSGSIGSGFYQAQY